MGGPVDFSSLHHEEEALRTLFVKEIDGSACDVLQGHVARLAVNEVGNGGAVDL